MSLDADDKDRVLRYFDRESAANRSEILSDFDSFTDWLGAIGTLLKLFEYAWKLYKWIRSKRR